jgi:hypothetical protein
VLTPFEGRAPLSPLYAFWIPGWRPAAVLFLLLAAFVAAIAPRLLDERWSEARFGGALLALALALPLALFLVREGPDRLGMQFLIYPGEEYFDDARRITDLGGFIRHYPELAPYLSLHGRVHPPGFAVFLFAAARALGPSPLAAGVAVLAAFAAGVLLTWRACAALMERRQARLAALLLLATPSLLDFACTSMDIVFFAAAGAVSWATFVSLSDRGRWWHAVLAGATGYLAAFCSFSAAPVALFVAVFAAARSWLTGTRRPLLQLTVGFAAFMAAHLLVRFATGFDLRASFDVARQQHFAIMSSVVGQDVGSLYLRLTFGNVAALLIGTGLGIVPLLLHWWSARQTPDSRQSSSGIRLRCLTIATAVTLAAICAGGIYTMETERILVFAMPWLALMAAGSNRLLDSAVRLALAAGLAQAFAMEAVLFTLW